MAVTIDSYNSSGNYQSQSSITWSHTISGTSRVLVVLLKSDRNIDPTSVTYGGVALSEAAAINRNAGIGVDFMGQLSIWYLIAPTVGTANIVVTLPSAMSSFAYSVSFNNALTPTYNDSHASVLANGDPYGGAIGVGPGRDSSNDMSIGWIVTTTSSGGVAETSGTQLEKVADNGITRSIGYGLDPNVTPLIWNVSGGPWGAIGVTIKAGTQPSASASTSPSSSPSKSPSISPSKSPSISPSASPSTSPSASQSPSASPSVSPSASLSPSASPSVSPSKSPSLSPSPSASMSPSVSPSPSPDNYTFEDLTANTYTYEDEQLES